MNPSARDITGPTRRSRAPGRPSGRPIGGRRPTSHRGELGPRGASGIAGIRGDSSRGGIALAGILATVLIIVLLLWMQDRDPAGFEQFEIEVRDDLPATIDDAARSRA